MPKSLEVGAEARYVSSGGRDTAGAQSTPASKEYPYIYSWGPRGNLPGAMARKGEACRIVAPPPGKRADMNSALIEFERDGYRAVISRNALRRRK